MSPHPQNPPATDADPFEKLFTPSEVARLFKVDTRTVARWARTGKLPYLTTMGGHRRFPAGPVLAAAARARQEVAS